MPSTYSREELLWDLTFQDKCGRGIRRDSMLLVVGFLAWYFTTLLMFVPKVTI